MNFFIYRNSTIENIFGNHDFKYSGYNDIRFIDEEADAFVWFYLLPIESQGKQLISEIDSFFSTLRIVYEQLPPNKLFLIFTLQDFNVIKFEKSDFSLEKSIQNYNNDIIRYASERENIKVVDLYDFTRSYALDQLVDWKYYFTSKIIINPRLAHSFKNWFLLQIDKIQYKRKKCLIIDLDNTIWGGILGEDGIYGIKTGGDFPGNAFSMFQQNIAALSKIGVILAICSKNNEQDVLDAWKLNPDIKLKKEHIATYRINWLNKADNITQISEELNIGLDSIVFVDDSPTERELVKRLLPEVEVPDFPLHAYQLPAFFSSLLNTYFSIYSLTQEDTVKTEHYKANSKRIDEQKKFSDFKEYLMSLELEMQVNPATESSIKRVSQLTQKTNQFNLTTKRYNEQDIQNFLAKNGYVYCMTLKDKFGDSGISGVAILLQKSPISFEIDSLMVSCRVLGKDVEFAFINRILEILRTRKIETVSASYVPSQKNSQVQNFYTKVGFDLLEEENGTQIYRLDLRNYISKKTDHIKIIPT